MARSDTFYSMPVTEAQCVSETPLRPCVVIPVYNDWLATKKLLESLDAVLNGAKLSATVLLIDDASSELAPDGLLSGHEWRAFSKVEVLRLRSNLGHQRAIAVGLTFLYQERNALTAIVMDGDGEDLPEDVPRLLTAFEATGRNKVVFAERLRRSEGLVFTTFYHIYRLLHRILVGLSVRFGNFSVVPRELIGRLVVVPDMWNHYAASVMKARLPHTSVPVARGRRLAGQSKMNFTSLVGHGLRAFSVFGEQIGVRLLLACLMLTLIFGGLIGAVVVIRIGTDWGIPGWATSTIGLLLVLMMQTLFFSVVATIFIIHTRGGAEFLPARDCHHYILDVRALLDT